MLLVFDGFDEMSNEIKEKSIFRRILDGRLAPRSSFVVTIRPISAESLYHAWTGEWRSVGSERKN